MEARLANAESLTEQANSELLTLRSAAQKTASRREVDSHQLAALEKLQEVRNCTANKLLVLDWNMHVIQNTQMLLRYYIYISLKSTIFKSFTITRWRVIISGEGPIVAGTANRV